MSRTTSYKIGRQTQFGVLKESTRGTTPAGSGAKWIGWDDLAFQDKRKNIAEDSAYGIIENITGKTQVKKWAEGALKTHVADQTFGYFLLSLMGTDTPAQVGGDATVYDHVFTVAESPQHQSISFYLHDASIQDYSFANGMCSKLELEYALGKYVSYSASLRAKSGASQTAYTPSQTAENQFVPQYLVVKVAANVAGLAAATAFPLKNAKITFDADCEDFEGMGQLDPYDIFNKEFKVSGTIEAIFANEADFKTAFLATTAQAMSLTLVNTDVTIGSTSHPSLTIQLDQVYFEDLDVKRTLKDLVYQTVKFEAVYNASATEMIKVTLRNLLSVY
jgi:hypothetical protein